MQSRKNAFIEQRYSQSLRGYVDERTCDHIYLYAWDQKEELWMRSYFRFVDAQGLVNRPGPAPGTNLFSTPLREPFLAPPIPESGGDGKKGKGRIGGYGGYTL